MSECKGTFECKKCGGPHVRNACALASISNGAAIDSKSVQLFVQDITVPCKSNKFAWVLFDNSPQTTLVRNIFAASMWWSYIKASYS